MVYGRKQTYIHTTYANAVTLVWGSLRLATIILAWTYLSVEVLLVVLLVEELWVEELWVLGL